MLLYKQNKNIDVLLYTVYDVFVSKETSRAAIPVQCKNIFSAVNETFGRFSQTSQFQLKVFPHNALLTLDSVLGTVACEHHNQKHNIIKLIPTAELRIEHTVTCCHAYSTQKAHVIPAGSLMP